MSAAFEAVLAALAPFDLPGLFSSIAPIVGALVAGCAIAIAGLIVASRQEGRQ